MIYVVTQQILEEYEDFKTISVEESLALLDPLKECALDIETTGLDPYTCRITMLQLGNEKNQIVIDLSTISLNFYRNYLESNRLFIGQNIKFDSKFLLHKNIVLKRVYDTMIADKVIYMGRDPISSKNPFGMTYSLSALCRRYLNITLDKTVRSTITQMTALTSSIIIYGAKDIEYLPLIKEKQTEVLKEKDLIVAAFYEFKFILPTAYTELCGVKLNEDRWKAKMAKDQTRLNNAINAMNQILREDFGDEYVYYDFQGDLFNGYDTEPKSKVSWSKRGQVAKILKRLGFNLLVKDDKTGELKDSVGGGVIAEQLDVHRIAPYYVEYKKAEKIVTTYGQNILDLINPVSGRLHTNVNQIDTKTGRLSTGGTIANPGLNFQNFPKNAETRASFVSEEGNDFISCDYSGQESRVIADLTKDDAMIAVFNTGCGDIHSLVAKMLYPQIIGDTPIEDIKRMYPELREGAKPVEFTINYGGNDYTLHHESGIPKDEAKILYDNYMNSFPKVKEYQDRQKEFVIKNGYILINDKSGHKSIIDYYERYINYKSQLTPEFWDRYRNIPRNEHGKKYSSDPEEQEMIRVVRMTFVLESEMVKAAINYRCQGTGALMFKLGTIMFWEYILKHDLLFKVKLCIPVHDEWNVESPEELTPTITKVLQKCMADAGHYFCDSLEMPSTAEVHKHWVH